MRFETKAIHAGAEVDVATGAVSPPLYLSTTFERDLQGGTPRGYSYVRDANPTQHRLEEALAAIDSGEGALAFASGMSAASALLQSLPNRASAGAHVLFPDDSYYAIRSIAGEYFPHWGASSDFIAMEDLDGV
ncbi:MAG TPA: PLP-dependent transferase, partial [Thermoanaerobaculia bacterium]